MMFLIFTTKHLSKVAFGCSILMLSLFYNPGGLPAAENAPSSNVLVEVDGVKLSQDEVDKKTASILEALKSRYPQDQLGNIKLDIQKKLIEDFIISTILNQEAERRNTVISENEVTAAIDEIAKELPQGMTMEDALKQSGLSMHDMQENVRLSLLINKLLEPRTKNNSPPSDKQIEEYYTSNKKQFSKPETVKARHILVKVSDKDDVKTKREKKEEIEALRKQLLQGADFAKIAAEHSGCPSAAKGGDLGSFPRGRMVKAFEDAAFSQKVNEIGPVVQTKFGYHIIQVLDHAQATSTSLEDAKPRIKSFLEQQQKQDLIQTYLSELREKATITYGTIAEPAK